MHLEHPINNEWCHWLQRDLEGQLAEKVAQLQQLRQQNAAQASEICQLHQQICSMQDAMQSVQEGQHEVCPLWGTKGTHAKHALGKESLMTNTR